MNPIRITCYNCRSAQSEPYDIENGWIYEKCNNCGLIYLNPRPSNEEINTAMKSEFMEEIIH